MRIAGVAKIVRFNWPWYLLAILLALAIFAASASGTLPGPWIGPGLAALSLGGFWMVSSLAVSHYVYDRSPVCHGDWLRGDGVASARTVVVFHAGQDEASGIAARRLPSAEIRAMDFFDSKRNGTASLKRARGLAVERAESISPGHIPLADGSLDLGLLAFAAHEIRDEGEREIFFSELARVLEPGGRILVLEHLRDSWTFLAFGPGAYHFLPRKTWLRAFSRAGLEVRHESPITPFVRRFELRKKHGP
jgi:SAM-dependent methyltransferase